MKVAFEPPSDYVPPSSGGGKSKIWMILGGGCLVVLLIIGIFFAAGAFKAVSCCNQLQDVAERSMAAQTFAIGWGTQVGAGDLDAAYQALSPTAKGNMSLEDFKALVAENAADMKDVNPQMFNTNAVNQESISDIKAWRMTLQFARPTGKQMTLLEFDVVVADPDAKIFNVENINFVTRERVMSAEPPASEVMQFHQELQSGRYEMAYGRMPKEFKDATSMDAFKAFLDAEGSILTGSDLEVTEVSYPAQNRATVMAIARKGEQKAVVQYELQTPPLAGIKLWQIVAISPTLQTNVDNVPEPEGASDGEDVDAATPSEETPENP